MNDLEILQRMLGVSEDDAATVLQLCDWVDQERAIAAYGYPKDTPGGRDLAVLLADVAYRRRLRELAIDEELDDGLIEALAGSPKEPS